MNDTKWRRLLRALAPISLPVSYWTFVNEDVEYLRPTPQPDEIVNGVAVGDTSIVGPFYFRDVKSVRWPKRYEIAYGPHEPPRAFTQPVEQLIVAINAAGQFDICETEGDLVLYAYR
ncbi:hypothetical protein LOC67_17200 [Stieleria sp. JC731]|uniref:hypothetical protein n=1 Tax=Pirellulaceae TaxID=2691357 RepID=UPI001E30EDD8|nr:hypothetical protein [Stieleria sp. JC731]MCC9602294.1 hypothetical protein [Stieleria sp. JC731]